MSSFLTDFVAFTSGLSGALFFARGVVYFFRMSACIPRDRKLALAILPFSKCKTTY